MLCSTLDLDWKGRLMPEKIIFGSLDPHIALWLKLKIEVSKDKRQRETHLMVGKTVKWLEQTP